MDQDTLNLLLQILGAQSGQTSPMFNASALANVAPSSISSALNPEVLLASGLLDPNALGAGIAGTEQQLYQKFLADTTKNVQVPLEATPMWFRDESNKYGVQAMTDPNTGRLAFAPTANNDLSDYMATQFNAIINGEITASQAKTALADAVSKDDRYKPFASQLTGIQNALDAFEKKATASNNAALKYEYDRTQAAGSAVAPTRQQALQEYYKTMGVPQLALLGDPTATYQIPSQLFERGQVVSDLEKELAKQQQAMARGENRFGSQAGYESKQAQVYAQKAIADEARRRGLEAQAAYDKSQKSNIVDETVNKVIDWFSKGRVIKDVLGTDMTDKRKQAYQTAYDTAIKELSANAGAPQIGVADLSKDYGLAKAKAYTAEKALQSEKDRAARVAELIGQGLASRGQTPFNAQLQQLLGYAVTAKKNK